MKVGLCALIKDCPPKYYQEWLNWHRSIGVDWFFIYDNSSVIPLVSEPDVIVKQFPGVVKQLPAYNDCLSLLHKGVLPKCDWVAFIDDDEFITLDNSDLKSLLATKEQYSGLGLNWILYGSSEPEDFDLPQKQKYKKHLPVEHDINRHIKSIIRPEKVSRFINPHYGIYTDGFCVAIDNSVVKGAFADKSIKHTGWLEHYYCRSEQEWRVKIQRGRCDKVGTYPMERFYEINKLATVTDEKR